LFDFFVFLLYDHLGKGGVRLVIMGIDPGLATLGYGIVSYDGNRVTPLDYGVITTPAKVPLPRRLVMLYEGIEELVRQNAPDDIALEELFFSKNVTTGIQVGHARGAAIVALRQYSESLYEYTPMQIKQAVAGYGKADKQQVQHMVKTLLNLREIPRPDDAADALALAICHAHSSRFRAEYKIQ
jgi:crossover junction endodeoxyribonuclease RuvC